MIFDSGFSNVKKQGLEIWLSTIIYELFWWSFAQLFINVLNGSSIQKQRSKKQRLIEYCKCYYLMCFTCFD